MGKLLLGLLLRWLRRCGGRVVLLPWPLRWLLRLLLRLLLPAAVDAATNRPRRQRRREWRRERRRGRGGQLEGGPPRGGPHPGLLRRQRRWRAAPAWRPRRVAARRGHAGHNQRADPLPRGALHGGNHRGDGASVELPGRRHGPLRHHRARLRRREDGSRGRRHRTAGRLADEQGRPLIGKWLLLRLLLGLLLGMLRGRLLLLKLAGLAPPCCCCCCRPCRHGACRA